MGFFKTIDKLIRKLPGRKKDFEKVIDKLSPLVEALTDSVKNHDLNIDMLGIEIISGVIKGKKFDELLEIGRDYLKREGKELRDEALGALINSIQIQYRVRL